MVNFNGIFVVPFVTLYDRSVYPILAVFPGSSDPYCTASLMSGLIEGNK